MALEMWQEVQEMFWSRHFWLPNNVTWDVFDDETMFLPKPRDLWVPFPLAIGLFILRLIWERYIAYPIGKSFKLSEKPPRRPVHSDVLEEAFKTHKKRLPDHKILQGYSKQTDWTVRQIERWWRLRRIVNKPSEMQRFRETSWRFLFYLGAFWYGFFVLIEKPWFWDTKHCWYGWPKQEVTPEIYWYYMIELGFYWSLVISVIIDNKRKDFLEMIVHHVATITLMMFSWSNNMIRVGTLVLCIHDAVDYWMEGAKMANYLKYGKLCDALFVVFTVVWFFTRILIFPLRIIHCTLNEGHHMLGICPIYYVYNILLIILQVLHIIWFISILRMVHQYVVKGKRDSEPSKALDASKPGVTPSCLYIFALVVKRVLRSSYYESYAIIGPFTSHSLFNSLLLILQVLHIFWFYRILRMVYLYIIKGQVEKDERSETSPDSDSDDEKICENPKDKKMERNGAVHGDHPNNNVKAQQKQ